MLGVMRGPNRVVLAGACLALVTGLGCDPVRGLGDAGPGGDDDDDDASVGAPDASTIPPGDVTVRVHDSTDQPLDGAQVLFHDPRGELVDQLFTGSDGMVSARVEADSFVTVTQSYEDDDGIYHHLDTIHGVMPGDEILVAPRVPDPTWEHIGDLTYSFSAPYSGAVDYYVHLGCNRQWTDDVTNEQMFSVDDDECTHGADQYDILFTAHGADGAPLAFAVAPGVDIDSTLISPNWQTNWRNVSLRADDAPQNLVMVRPELSLVHRKLDYRIEEPVGRTLSAGQGAVFAMKAPPTFASVMQARLTGFYSDGGVAAADGLTMIVRNVAGNATDIAANLTTDLLPRVHDVKVNKLADQWQVSFAVVGDMPDVSALAAGVTWIDRSGSKPVQWEWAIVADPRLGPPIRVPLMPANAVVHPGEGTNHWPPPESAETTQLAAGLVDTPPGAWTFYHQQRPFDFFDHPLSLDAAAGMRARISVGGLFEFGD